MNHSIIHSGAPDQAPNHGRSIAVNGNEAVEAEKPGRHFANFDVVPQAWYVAGRSRKIRTGKAVTVDWLGRRVVLWRDSSGNVHAMDARCPHLGADLGQGTVVGDALRCPFHHWEYDATGACVHAPGHNIPPNRSARTIPVAERYALIWLFNGNTPSYTLPPLPDGNNPEEYRIILPPSQHIDCHPDLVIGNGLDAVHFEALHGMIPTSEPVLEQPSAQTLSLTMSGRPASRVLARLTGTTRTDAKFRFTTIGAGLAWVTVMTPIRFHVLFTAKCSERHGSDTQVVLFLPRNPFRTVQASLMVYTLLHDDRKILEGLDFHRGFSETDEPLQRYADIIDTMEVEG